VSGSGKSADGRVVVGVDGSEPSVQAAVYAAEVSGRRGVGLLVVHVTPWHETGDALPMSDRDVKARFQESATRLVEAAADSVRQRTGLSDVTAAVLDDYPVDGLLSLSSDAALLVIGRRGMGGLPGLLLGSTAGGVVQHAQCPVLVLPDDHGEPAEPGRSVVVGVEGRAGDEEVLAFAVAEARARGTDLTAVHAWADLTLEAAVGGFGPLVDWSGVEEEQRRHLSAAVAAARAEVSDLTISEVVLRERAPTALLTASAAAQLLVVGHRQRGRLARLGSTTYGVLHRAACPVAVVPLSR
jgi:nucleotide-binding universal stress UspA family protein